MSYIVKKGRHALIAYKPAGVLSEDSPTDKSNIIFLVGEELFALGESRELYAVHRLDRTVGGLLLLARNRRSAAELSALVCEEGFGKEYLAVVEGTPEADSGKLTDFLKRDKILGKAVRADASDSSARKAVLSYKALATAEGRKGRISLLAVTLETGRFHQIRAQLSLRGLPLVGDSKYGSRDRFARAPSLFCSYLEATASGETLCARIAPPTDVYPWSEFREIIEDTYPSK